MLITIPVNELKENDVLNGDGIEGQPIPSEVENSRSIISEAYNIPTSSGRTFERASRVSRPVKIGRMYVHITLDTYAVVRRLKGTRVSVYRNGENGAQESAPAVVEAAKQDEYADKPADFVDEGGAAYLSKSFGYVRSQFKKLGTMENARAYKLQIWGENSAHTKWLNVHPDDLAKIQVILELRETEENCPHRVYLAGICTLCGKLESRDDS